MNPQNQAETSLAHTPRIWTGPIATPETGEQVRLFRRRIDTPQTPRAVRLELFAESIYNLYVNGQHVQRGPAFHHANRLPVISLDLTPCWQAGTNVIAVSVLARTTATHNSIPAGKCGLVANVVITEADGSERTIATDEQWRVTDCSGWTTDAPKRNWALGPIEVYDVAAAPLGWQDMDFDDSDWPAAEIAEQAIELTGLTWLTDVPPAMSEQWVPARKIMAVETAPTSDFSVRGQTSQTPYAEFLEGHDWQAADAEAVHGELDGETPLQINNLTPDRATVVWVDLGREYVGQVCLDATCDSAGIIDVGWSEIAPGGRPKLVVKGSVYVDEVHAQPGPLRWEPLGFSGMRYLALILRGFTGSVTISRWGVRATQPAVNWQGTFECSDEKLNAIWQASERSIRVGTQEGLMDCPSREQATYVGDGHPVARWMGLLTGDYRNWRYLVREQFARPTREGLVRSTPFSGATNCILDYEALAIIGARDYLAATGDADTVRDILPACRNLLQWFRDHQREDGLLPLGHDKPHDGGHNWESRYDPHHWDEHWFWFLFIDHPGMGWHNVNEPGIDRSGINAAINALHVLQLRAMADLEDAVGDGSGHALRQDADALATLIGETFYDEDRGVFADGIAKTDDATPLKQISQQTNALCLLAGALDAERSRDVLSRILEPIDKRPDIARSGPYFWYYMLPAMTACGMDAEALQQIQERWWPMIEAGATTLWETFAGDEKDTWCHPWSAACLWFLSTRVLGFDIPSLNSGSGMLRPRWDLLAAARGQVGLTGGPASIAWKTDGDEIHLTGALPDGVSADLHTPDGQRLQTVRGEWDATYPRT